MLKENKYEQRGVSADKEEVHNAIKGLDMGLFPNAFCKIFPDLLAGSSDYVNLMSADGSGTKSIIAYLYWKETGDLSVWRGIAQDVIVMNLDDMLCSGATGPFLFSSLINRNKSNISGEVIKAIIDGGQAFFDDMANYGIDICYTGGETADLGDSVRTITVDGSMISRMPKKQLIDNGNIKAGNVIVGLASFGKAIYENNWNSGIGSNGLTSARHDLLAHQYYNSYPECADPTINEELAYSGPFKLQDKLEEHELDIGKALLSPTRTYAPLLKQIIQQYSTEICGIMHNTGGAHSKILHFVERVKIIKDRLFEPPEIFCKIQSASGVSLNEMYKVFNMGTRMEVYTNPKTAESIIELANEFQIDAQLIGEVVSSKKKEVKLNLNGEQIIYN